MLLFYGKETDEFKRNGHNLKKLWSDLLVIDAKSAKHIQEYVTSVFKKDESFFEKTLDESAKSFEQWRYLYESDSFIGHPQFIREFCIALKIECDRCLEELNNSHL